MVILVETYDCVYERVWLGGHPTKTCLRLVKISGMYEQWIVISKWKVVKVKWLF